MNPEYWVGQGVLGGLFIVFLTLIVRMAKWAAPRIEEIVVSMNSRLDREEKRALEQLSACTTNITTVTNTHEKVKAHSDAIIQMLQGAKLAMPEVMQGNDELAQRVVAHLDEAERIIREAG
jgi:cell division septal protein FtsQ